MQVSPSDIVVSDQTHRPGTARVGEGTSPREGLEECNGAVSDDTAGQPLPQHKCPRCSRRYERLDHLKRHELSHQNSRTHLCEYCGRRFNRRDLLTRHLASHDPSEEKNGNTSQRPGRAIQACESCIQAKTRCGSQRPCQRCLARGTKCEDKPFRRGWRALANRPDFHDARIHGSESNQSISSPLIDSSQQQSHSLQESDDSGLRPERPPGAAQGNGEAPHVTNSMHNAETLLSPQDSLQHNTADHMAIGDVSWSALDLPEDIFPMYQDLDLSLEDPLQTFQFDPAAMDFLTSDTTGQLDFAPAATNGNHGNDLSPASDRTTLSDTCIPGYNAFKKSPWLWTPAHRDHAYAENQQLSVDENQIMQSPEISQARPTPVQVPRMHHTASRDEVLGLVLKFSKTQLKVRSFPSFNLLNVLMQAFFVKEDASSDACVHAATFDADSCRSELLAAIVAAGSTLFAVRNVWEMGLALQEIVKLAIADAVDNDNSLARNLQANQAFFLWIELGIWSGFRRKMEIGEGFAHTVPTMLRRAGAFRQSYYPPSIIPSARDEGDQLRKLWRQWVDQESYKRLVLRVFIHEMRSSIAFIRNPVLSLSEITFGLPASRDVWDAQSAEEWKARMLAKPRSTSFANLLDGMHDPSKLETQRSCIDMGLSSLAILYGLWGRVYSFLDSRSFSFQGEPASAKVTTGLWVEAQRQEIYQRTQKVVLKLAWLQTLPPEAVLVSELIMMTLHISPEAIQKFAGRYGEEEFRSALPQLADWVHGEDRYHALWHAGQVIRAARSYPPTQLRGFHAIALYHACLTLWAFSVLSRKSPTSQLASPAPRSSVLQRPAASTARTTNVESMPETGDVSQNRLPASRSQHQPQSGYGATTVLLDGEDTAPVQMFLKLGHGKPCIQVNGSTRELNSAEVISAVMSEVFRANFPSKSHPLPPLLENLNTLMGELSRNHSS